MNASTSIQVTTPNGRPSWSTINSSTANDGAQSWRVTKPATTSARIRVCSVQNSSLCDTKDANFTIQ